MGTLLSLIPAFPLAGFVVLALCGKALPSKLSALIGCAAVGASMLCALRAGTLFLAENWQPHSLVLWDWISAGTYSSKILLLLDPLSLVMISVVTVVGFLIHVYSAAFLEGDEGYSRFFAYMNLFVFSMLVLVLAGDLLLLLLGWEGVGLCSYLLIGFWYREPENGRAARKAFIVTRVGDTALLIALFLVFYRFGTLDILKVILQARSLPAGSGIALAAGLLLLGGAAGKSAQIPLQVWLPDAMAGPSPVSALIHAATMVTAGVYLIARMNVFFLVAPAAQMSVAAVGSVTLLLAACSALVVTDLKRVLAYSTISQIGYMFLALGVGAWSAAVFHLVTHALFKSLLFLSAGVVIQALHEEHDIFRMGGLRKSMPVVFWTFLAGAASLAAIPFLTAGFYSKDTILRVAAEYPATRLFLWAGLLGSFLTSLYAFRLVFVVFFGQERLRPRLTEGNLMRIPLILLALGALIAGVVEAPVFRGKTLDSLLEMSVPVPAHPPNPAPLLEVVLVLIPLLGAALAYRLYGARPLAAIAAPPALSPVVRFWTSGWGFDALYQALFVSPFLSFAAFVKSDPIDRIYALIQSINLGLFRFFRLAQTGFVRSYLAGIVVGAILFLAIMVLL